jgi:serine/threonine-protein kinase
MDPHRWRQIDTVFQNALKSDPDLRSVLLDEACAEDAELRDEVQTLLIAHELADCLDTTALELAAALEPDPLRLEQGQTLGPYLIMDHIATGGMGTMYLAEDPKLDRKIALKVLTADFASDQERILRFRQEARAASGLNHPNIITIYDIGEETGTHYIAMEFVEGYTVRQHLAVRNLTTNEALDIAIQAAGALEAAHQAGIVHRDIKPENIMIRPDGYVKVLDFGLAKLSESESPDSSGRTARREAVDTEPGMVMGTARYMSPEQARGKRLDGRTDVFSLGVVLYEMITGEPPFKGDTAIDAVAAVLNADPEPLAVHAPSAPPELEPIVRKALCKNRLERYDSMGRFLSDLVDIRQRAGPSGPAPQLPLISEAAGASGTRSTENTGPAERTPSAVNAATKTGASRVWMIGAAFIILFVAIGAYLYGKRGTRDSVLPTSAATNAINSIAVLPFVDATKDKNDDYLTEGITDNLIDSLSRVSRLNVMSPQSALRYKGRQIDPDVAGRELGVETVISGEVTGSDDGLSINVEIADANSNRQTWHRQYSGRISDILGLQEQISREVSSALLPGLTASDQRAIYKQFTQSADAYVSYLRGLHSMSLRTPEGLRESIELFGQAVSKDQRYAPAYAGLADAYVFLGDYGIRSPKEATDLAQTAVAKALFIDDNLAEAHTTLGHLKLYYYLDWKDAEAQFKRAIDIEPNYAAAHQGLANYYGAQGRFGEAIAEINTALRYDPLSPNLNQAKGFHLYLAGNYDDAIRQLDVALQYNPVFPPAHAVLGMAYLQKGEKDGALEEFKKSVELSNGSPAYLAQLGRAYAVVGNVAKAQESIDELKSLGRKGFIGSYWLAIIYAALGDVDQALKLIHSAIEEHDSEVIFINVGPTFGKLRSDPEFRKVLSGIGLDR